jgi:hypothetical protein
MKQTAFALAFAALTLTAAASVSQAAPIAPPTAGVSVAHGNLTKVQWWWHGRRWEHRHCGRGPFGRLHCRYW